MNRTRDWRRAQRDRVIANRLRDAQSHGNFLRVGTNPSRLARHNTWLGCPEGRDCDWCVNNRTLQRDLIADSLHWHPHANDITDFEQDPILDWAIRR